MRTRAIISGGVGEGVRVGPKDIRPAWALALGLLSIIAMMAVWPLASVADAKSKIYGGRAALGGRLAMDVELSRNGKVAKKVTEVRAVGLLGTCEISGPNIQISATVTGDMKVDADGRFKFKAVDELGHPRSVKGRFAGKNDKKVEGTFLYEKLFPEEGPWPEEVCTTNPQSYSLAKGGKNVIEPVAQKVGAALR